MAKTASEMVRGAFDRAKGRGVLVHYLATSPAGFATYAVDSSASVDTCYVVTVSRAGRFTCTCPAADKGREACWHKAAVATVRACRIGFGLPADGPSAHQHAAERVSAAPAADAFPVPDAAAVLAAAEREHARRRTAEIAALFAA